MTKTLISGKKSVPQKLIVVALLLISMIILFCPWAKVSVEVMGEELSVEDIIRRSGTTPKELEMELREELPYISDTFADLGIPFNGNKLMNLLCDLLDGRISIMEIVRSCSYIGNLLDDFLKRQDSYAMFFIQTSGLEELKNGAIFISILLRTFVVVAVVSVLYAIYAVFTNKKSGTRMYVGTVTVLLLMFAIAVYMVNSSLSKKAGYLIALLDDYDLIGNMSSVDFHILKLTGSAFLCPLMAVLASIVAAGKKTEQINLKKIPVPVLDWECTCGSKNSEESKFCGNCGTSKPALRYCACGAEITEDTRFCANCGRPANSVVTPPPVPVPRRCDCGAEISSKSRFCGKCGKPVAGVAAPAFTPEWKLF